jgi:phenylalanyl-tRNA synthetase beta chain
VDLIEEIARLKGYDAFPVELRPLRPSVVPDDPMEGTKARMRRIFTGFGLNEARSYPLAGSAGENAVPLSNPLSGEDAYLRTGLLPGLVRAAERNWSVRERDVRLFEIGTVFHRGKESGSLPVETLRLAGVISGARVPSHWTAAGKSEDYDLWDLKNLFEEAARVAQPGSAVIPRDLGWMLSDGFGRAHPLEADQPAWAARLFGFELDIHPEGVTAARFTTLPGTPPLERDLALVLPPGLTADKVGAVMRRSGGPLLESARVFDEYKSGELTGRSVAWRLVFRAPERTLRDEEVESIVKRTLAVLKEELGVGLRES